MDIDVITKAIIAAGMKVHSKLGPGLLESAYRACLAYELRKRGFKVAEELTLPVRYDDVDINAGYRLYLLVNDGVIVELKACECILPIHQAQLLTYLKLSGKRIGLLLNFNVEHLKDGIKRMAN